MKKLCLSLSILITFAASAQDAEQVVQKYIETLGGLEAFKKVNTARFSGTVISQGNNLPLTLQVINDKAMRLDVTAMGKQVVNVYSDGKGWKINPFAGAATAVEVSGSELINFKAQASLINQLADYQARKHSIAYGGEETVNGQVAQKILLTSANDGKLTTYFIDKATKLLVKSVAKREINGAEYDAETFYSGVKIVNGLRFSMDVKVMVAGRIFQEVHYKTVELNVPVDEKILVMPR